MNMAPIIPIQSVQKESQSKSLALCKHPLGFFFKKHNRLLRSRDFRLCAQHGEERIGRFMIIQMRKTTPPDLKFGLIVSRKYGKASKRNRFKRLMREAFRHAQHTLPLHLHITVRPRHQALNASFAEIQNEFLELLPTSDLSKFN